MFGAIGFLAAGVCILAVVPLVHNRAVRLTIRQMQGAIPLDVAEVHAQKDLARAEYALAVRKIEQRLEEARANATGYRMEASRKAVEAEQLKLELTRATALLLELHARAQTHRETARRIVRLVVYLFARSRRERRPIFLAAAPRVRRLPEWMEAAANT